MENMLESFNIVYKLLRKSFFNITTTLYRGDIITTTLTKEFLLGTSQAVGVLPLHIMCTKQTLECDVLRNLAVKGHPRKI